jgi:hypothetical protein
MSDPDAKKKLRNVSLAVAIQLRDESGTGWNIAREPCSLQISSAKHSHIESLPLTNDLAIQSRKTTGKDCMQVGGLELESDLAETVVEAGAGGFRIEEDEQAYPPFTRFRKLPDHLKVTTRRGGRINSLHQSQGFVPCARSFSSRKICQSLKPGHHHQIPGTPLSVRAGIPCDLNGLALGKAQFGLKALYDVFFRQSHEGGSVWLVVERVGKMIFCLQKFLFLSTSCC